LLKRDLLGSTVNKHTENNTIFQNEENMKRLLSVALMFLVSLVEMAMSRLSRYLARTPPQTASALPRLLLAILILFVGCSTVGTAPLTLPTGLSPVVGGITDLRPYFGKFKAASDNSEGDFLLAGCGCGDWRVLMSTADGKQWQFPVRFYSTGDYQPTGDVKVFDRHGGVARHCPSGRGADRRVEQPQHDWA
jgi:hypothetical protein